MRFKEFKLLEAVSNPEVVKQQEKLRDLGYDLGSYGPKGDGVDGIIGPYTQAAIDAHTKGIAPNQAPKPDPIAVAKFDKETGQGNDVPSGLPVKGQVSSPFGHRTSVGNAHNHNGTDFAVVVGTPVVAPADGVVKSAGDNGGGEGVFVILDAGDAVHKFFHLSQIKVKSGQKVSKGEILALSGNTGYSTGPHLHWEKHVAGRPVDPMANIG
jgi:murein DD-endopeptidase MepM/ murein hydrolase activator NlpD